MITEEEIYQSFQSVIKKNDKVIILYSGLWQFINNLPFKKKISSNLLTIIEKIVTKNRTLILPSFSSQIFTKKTKFIVDKTIDNSNGMLPKEALKRKKYYRTPQPLHSYLCFGKKVNEIRKLKYETSWGKTSLFEWLSLNNARICVLGIPWNKGCSYLHRFEELYSVPWRYFKLFSKPVYKNNKKIGVYNEKKFSSPKKIFLDYDYMPIIKKMYKNKVILKSYNKKFFLESAKISDIDKVCHSYFLRENYWNIIKNKRKIKKWIKEEKSSEIINSTK